MVTKRTIYYLMIILGGIAVFYAMDEAIKNKYLLAIGIILLMFGLYSVAKGISPKSHQQDNFIQTEEEE
jgi:disulfide bond formation protein DsbB